MNQSSTIDFGALVQAVYDAGLMQSTCTVQAPSGNLGASGAPDNTYVDVAGLVNIACMNAPESVGNIAATEVKNIAEIMSISLRHVLLNGYFSQLDGQNWGEVGWHAIVDGIDYDILGAERDSQFSQTRLKLRLVSI
jgi:hypothetical protein